MAAQIQIVRAGKTGGKKALEPGRAVVIGRTEDSDWTVSGEPFLSRRHAEVTLEGDRLQVKRLPSASNPVFLNGEESTEFSIGSGEYFTIGQTRFRFFIKENVKVSAEASLTPQVAQTLTVQELYNMGGSSDRARLLDLLELPEIMRSKDSGDFYSHIAGMIRMASNAAWSCVVDQDGKVLGEDSADDGARYRISKSLVKKAIEDSPQPTLYCWSAGSQELQATVVEGIDWAVCAAAKIPGKANVCLYAAGKGEGDANVSDNMRDSARFIGLVADVVGRSMSVDHLQAMEKRLSRFFAGPIVSKILKSPDLKELEPRLAQSTIMFFDIRGFSKRTEDKNEKILAYLGELKRVLSAMTRIILDEKGVVLKYTGDGIFACWNVPFDDPKHVDCACRAALRMAAEMAKVSDGWRCGIGLQTGEVVAGAMGSEQVFSYDAMGSVVNQASRVEGITKFLETPILVTHGVVDLMTPSVATAMRVGRFQPAGMNTALDLYELTEPPGDEERIKAFSTGLSAFEKGDWEKAYEALDDLPAKDKSARFLKTLAEDHRRHPPKQWDGIIALEEK